MTGPTRSGRAARGDLARLVAVVAVLAGLVLTHGLPCADGATGTHAAGTTCGHVRPADGLTDAAAPVPVSACAAPAGALDAGGFGGVLATCLAFVMAVVAAATGLRPARLWNAGRAVRSARAALARTVLPRAPSLAALCLLRT